MRYNIGDVVSVRVLTLHGRISKLIQTNDPPYTSVSNGYSPVEERMDFSIVGRDQDPKRDLYAIKLPDDAATGFIMSKSGLSGFDLLPDLESSVLCFINNDYILNHSPATPVVSVQKRSGMTCMNPACRIYCEWMDGPNLPGAKFLCYGCRTNPVTRTILGY